MAALIDASGDKYTVTSFDWNAAYTVAFWFRYDTYANGTVWQWHININNIEYVQILTNKLTLTSRNASSSGSSTGTTAINQGSWYHIAIVRESTTLLRGYVNAASDVTNAENVATRTTPPTPDIFPYAGSAAYRAGHLKVWTAALTAAEVANEMQAIRPLRQTDLWAWYPQLAGDRTLDWSGNGRTLTENGTISDAVDPGITFGGSVLYPMQDGAPAGGSTPGENDYLHSLRRGLRRYVFA